MDGAGADLTWDVVGAPALVMAGLAFAFCLLLVVTRRWHGRFTHDHVVGPQKFHRHEVSRIGGAGIALACFLAWPVVPEEVRPMWAAIMVASLPALIAGLGEDVTRRVGVRARLLATMGAGVIFAVLSGWTMNKVDLPGVDWILSFHVAALLFTGFAMGGVANAINIIDGFNGLASGSLMIMFGAFAWVALQVGDGLVFHLAILFAAPVVGFFALNFPSGRIFLGDGGAYFCGFLLAALGVLLPARNPEISAWTAVLICGYPVIETLASMRRKARREGHSVGQPDRVHFHMLVHRSFARRLVPGPGGEYRRNPVTSALTWGLPLMTTAFAMIAWNSTLLSAAFFFVTLFVYGRVYRHMSLNPARRGG
jgi:UDP-N-acetylmuramyl pentapeptide phosphotransferase/UDP-N-acetylglucosamine-1-phosphate transferase